MGGIRINKKKLKLFAGILIALVVLGGLTALFFPKEKEVYRYDGVALVDTVQPTKNVVLVVIDTLRADRVQAYGKREHITTPTIDALEKDAITFLETASAVPLTTPSHSAFFTGRYPYSTGVRDNNFFLQNGEVTLAEVLKNQGYRTAGFVSSFSVGSKFKIDQGFQFYDDKFDEDLFYPAGNTTIFAASQRRGDRTTDLALDWLDEHKDEKFFLWLHLYDAHSPYDGPNNELFGKPNWTYYEDTAFLKQHAFGAEAQAHKENTQSLYDGEVHFADEQVKRLFDRLEEYGLKEDALIIFMSDHGESLGEHNYFDHGKFIYEVTTKVPFLIYNNEYQHKQIETLVRTIDMFPTVLDMLGLPIPTNLDARSLIPLIKGETADEIPAFMESSSCFPFPPVENCKPAGIDGKRTAMKFNKQKIIISPGYDTPEFYDLDADPIETRNVFGRVDTEVFEKTLGAWRAKWEENPDVKLEDKETRDKLKSLGYLT